MNESLQAHVVESGPKESRSPAEIGERIRESTLDGLAMEESSDQLAKRRSALAEELECTPGHVRSVSAWVTIRIKQLLKECDMPAGFPVAAAAFCLNYARLTSDPKDLESATTELANNYQVAPDKMCRFAGRLVEAFSAKQPDLAELKVSSRREEDASLPKIPDASDEKRSTEKPPKGGTGAHINYGSFVTKELWRERWASFLERKFTASERANGMVLALLGKQVFPELKHYLRLGFRPENILAVEGGDAAARREFEDNAKRAGIKYRLGQLEDIVPTLPDSEITKPFMVVSYDFLGQVCPQYARILENTMIADKAAVLINLRGNRETKDVQDRFDFFCEASYGNIIRQAASTARDSSMRSTSIGNMSRVQSRKESSLAMQRYIENRPRHLIGERRDDCIERMLLSRISAERVQPLLNLPCYKELGMLGMAVIVRQLGLGMEDIFGKSTDATWQSFALSSLTQAPVLGESETYKYHSESSNSRAPYLSCFQMLHTPRDLYYKTRHSFKFIMACVNAVYLDGQAYKNDERDRPHFCRFRDKNNTLLRSTTELNAGTEVLHYTGEMSSPKLSATIRLGKLHGDLTEWANYVNEMAGNLPSRQLIEKNETQTSL